MAALGSEQVSLKGDADEGSVVLQMGDERYTRTLTRSGWGILTGGDPYLADAELADLFAFSWSRTRRAAPSPRAETCTN